MYITIGRIPDFNKFLPNGSKRIMSCNGVVTNHNIDFTSGRNQEYVRCIDLVIDVDAQLNYGKTHITNTHLVKLVREYINESYSRVLQRATGEFVGKLPNPDQDEFDEIYVGREDLGLEGFISRKIPHDENDVIGLFYELAGKDFVQNYRIFGLSQRSTYDGKAAILRPIDQEKELNTAKILSPEDDTKLRTIEFKLHASEVIRDFERKQKYSNEVHLVIAWDVGNYESRQYQIYDIEESDAYNASPKRTYPNVTKYIYDAKNGTEVQVFLLKDLVEQIKDEK